MRRHRTVATAALTVALSATGLATSVPAGAAPQTVRYPSVECPDTGATGLQDCVDGIGAGSTVVLADEVVDEDVQIAKSLTLRGARGIRPMLGYILLEDAGAGSSVRIDISDVRLRSGIIGTTFDQGSGHEVSIRRVEVGRGSGTASGIQVGSIVPTSLTVEDSYVRSVQEEQPALYFHSARDGGRARFRAVRNRITERGSTGGLGGIGAAISGKGSTDVRILGNAIVDVAQSGEVAGIALAVSDTVTVDADVVGNTVAVSGGGGMLLQAIVDPPGRVRLDLFDNSFTQAAYGVYVSVDDGANATIRAGHNNTYATKVGDGFGRFSKGPGNLHANPRFVDLAKGDLRLRADSPLIDKGMVCTPGGQLATDAAGRHRLAGRSVDIGAYERGAGRASGVMRMGTSASDRLRGTSGRDILCGLGGDDTLCAKDGRGGDWVDGGPGRDRGRTDGGDRRRSIESTGGC